MVFTFYSSVIFAEKNSILKVYFNFDLLGIIVLFLETCREVDSFNEFILNSISDAVGDDFFKFHTVRELGYCLFWIV